jgi:carbon monoxide dehydrogenase subunit G
MFTTIALVVVALIAIVLIAAAARPSSFRIERSTTIAAPPEKIVALIDDFHAWGQWSPWETIDPTMTRTFEGPERGVGAIYGWTGNGKAGTGRMEILEDSAAKVLIKLDFIKPFEAHNTAIFTLEPQGGATRVTWAMEGTQPFIAKLMGLIFNMEKMVGPDFEKGLASLKVGAET